MPAGSHRRRYRGGAGADQLPLPPLAALGLTAVGLWLAPRGELAARMLAGTVTMLAVTYFANRLGRS
jgi:galactitol-specific phosphotransferase system IIC component